MKRFLLRYIAENFDDLLNLDLKVARLLGIPAPHTLSSYAHATESRWEKYIDRFFHWLLLQEKHCHNDYKRVTNDGQILGTTRTRDQAKHQG